MNSLKTVAVKVKRSPQIIRKKFTSLQHGSIHQELREDWLHDPEPLKDGIPFYCKWLGTTQVFRAQGTGCTDAAIKQIVDDAKQVKSSKGADRKLQKVLVVVTTKTLKIEDMVTKELRMEIPIYRISYCTADPNYPKVFSFIAREKGSKTLQCHALLCNKESMAKAISLTVADAFSSAYDSFEEQNHANMTQALREIKSIDEPSASKPVSLLVLSQTASTENTTNPTQDDSENDLMKEASNPFNDDWEDSNFMNPFIQEERKALPNKRPLSEYSVNTPHIKISGDEFLAAASCSGSSESMKALDLAGTINDDFDAEFTRLAEGRSNSNLFETPVRRSDLQEDIAALLANENTALELANSQSTEDLLF